MKTLLIMITFVTIHFSGIAQIHDESLNHTHEFFIVKNEAKKQIIITADFVVSLPQEASLSVKNYEIKKLLADQLILSMVITHEEEMGCTYKAIATDEKGEFFDDEEDANRYRIKVMNAWRKKGYSVYEYPYKYKP